MQNYKFKFQKRYNKRKEINSQWNTILQLIDECEQSKAQLKSVDTNKLEKCMSLLCNQQYPIKTVSNESLRVSSLKLLSIIKDSDSVIISQFCLFLSTICLKQKPNYTSQQVSALVEFLLEQISVVQHFYLNDLLKSISSLLEHFNKDLKFYYSRIISLTIQYIDPCYTDLQIKQSTLTLLVYICSNASFLSLDDYTKLYNQLYQSFLIHQSGLYHDLLITKLISMILQCFHLMISSDSESFFDMKSNYSLQHLYSLLISILMDYYKQFGSSLSYESILHDLNAIQESTIPQFIITEQEQDKTNEELAILIQKCMNNIYTLFNTLLRVSKGLNDLNLNDSTTFFFYILYHDSSNSTVLSLLQILNTLLKKLKIDKWLLLNKVSTSQYISKSDDTLFILHHMNLYILILLKHASSLPISILKEICKILQLLYKSKVYCSKQNESFYHQFCAILYALIDILVHSSNDTLDASQKEVVYSTLSVCFQPLIAPESFIFTPQQLQQDLLYSFISSLILTSDHQNTQLMNHTLSYYQSKVLPCVDPSQSIDSSIDTIQYYTPPSYVSSFLCTILTYYTNQFFYYWNTFSSSLLHSFQMFDIQSRISSISLLSSLMSTKIILFSQFPTFIFTSILTIYESLLKSNIEKLRLSAIQSLSLLHEEQFYTLDCTQFTSIIESLNDLFSIPNQQDSYYEQLLQGIEPFSYSIVSIHAHSSFLSSFQSLLSSSHTNTVLSLCYSVLCSLFKYLSLQSTHTSSIDPLLDSIRTHFSYSEQIQINILRLSKYLFNYTDLQSISTIIQLFTTTLSEYYSSHTYNQHSKVIYNIDYFIQSFFVFLSSYYPTITNNEKEINLFFSLRLLCINSLLKQYDYSNIKLKSILYTALSSLSSYDYYGYIPLSNIYSIIKHDVQVNIQHSVCLYNTIYSLTINNTNETVINSYLQSLFHLLSHIIHIAPPSFLEETFIPDKTLLVQLLNLSINNVTDYLSSEDYTQVQSFIESL